VSKLVRHATADAAPPVLAPPEFARPPVTGAKPPVSTVLLGAPLVPPMAERFIAGHTLRWFDFNPSDLAVTDAKSFTQRAQLEKS
jgi:hypothetical protein